jgi:TetR/AcrR family tetracycline transcriptional repressor
VSVSRGHGQRAGLTQEAVLAASRELMDSAGAAALTMRALARRLDVAPNALYSHVANKTALLDLLLDDLLAAIPAVSPDTHDPVAGLTELMTATYQALTAHPDLVPVYLARQGARGPHAIRLGDLMDDLLSKAGINPTGVARARRALIIHAIGSAAFATGALAEPETSRPLGPEQSRSTFDHSLRWLLAGATQDAAVGGDHE